MRGVDAGKEVIFMALSDLPPIKPSKNAVYFMGIFLATFIFWFTRPKADDSTSTTDEQATNQ